MWSRFKTPNLRGMFCEPLGSNHCILVKSDKYLPKALGFLPCGIKCSFPRRAVLKMVPQNVAKHLLPTCSQLLKQSSLWESTWSTVTWQCSFTITLVTPDSTIFELFLSGAIERWITTRNESSCILYSGSRKLAVVLLRNLKREAPKLSLFIVV